MKNKYMKLLVICFLGMVVLTILSRAADSFTVAKVNAVDMKRGAIINTTVVAGTIDASKKIYVPSSIAFRINDIHVGEGSNVNVGDLLFTLDYEEVKEKAEEEADALAVLKLEIQKLRLASSGSAQELASVDSAQAELDRALADDAFNRSINDGKQMLEDKRKIEDAQSKLDAAKKSLSETKSSGDIDIQIKENELKQKQKDYDEIKKILDNKGQVIAEAAGSIGQIFAVQGSVNEQGNYCTIIPEDSSYIFSGEINIDDGEFLKMGDATSVTLSGKNVPLNSVTIKSVASNEGKMKVVADVPNESGVRVGVHADLTHENRSDEYRTLVPLSAIRGSEGNYFVLVVREESGILGKQKAAAMVPVEVKAKDNKNAAIEGTFNSEEPIITKSNKGIAEGDRVREQSTEIREK